MKIASKLCTIVAILWACGTCFADGMKDPVPTTIHARVTTVKSGDGITLDLTIANQSGGPVSFIASGHRDGFGVDYLIQMIAPGGKKKLSEPRYKGSAQIVTLAVGDEVKEELYLDDEFKIAEPGEYFIQVAPIKVVGDDYASGSWSNTIALTVTK